MQLNAARLSRREEMSLYRSHREVLSQRFAGATPCLRGRLEGGLGNFGNKGV